MLKKHFELKFNLKMSNSLDLMINHKIKSLVNGAAIHL
jgi:hypothetical protein